MMGMPREGRGRLCPVCSRVSGSWHTAWHTTDVRWITGEGMNGPRIELKQLHRHMSLFCSRLSQSHCNDWDYVVTACGKYLDF